MEKLCLGICGGEVVVWLVQGGVSDYVTNEAWPSIFMDEYGEDSVKKGQLRKTAK